jgi:hypothetical protein
MKDIKTITIRRIRPPIKPGRKKYSIENIMVAAKNLKKAVDKEEKMYGKFEMA